RRFLSRRTCPLVPLGLNRLDLVLLARDARKALLQALNRRWLAQVLGPEYVAALRPAGRTHRALGDADADCGTRDDLAAIAGTRGLRRRLCALSAAPRFDEVGAQLPHQLARDVRARIRPLKVRGQQRKKGRRRELVFTGFPDHGVPPRV